MKMRSLFALSIALCVGTVSALDINELVRGREVSDASKDQFKTLDQPFCFFKTIGEDPYMIVYHPGKNEIKTVTCGTRDKNGAARRAKKATDFVNLTPIRGTVLIADAGLKLDEKYRGYRKTVIGKFLDNTLKTIDLLPDRKYKGCVLVDEYQAGMPMKLVLRDAQDLSNLRKYLEYHFKRMAVIPSKKPLLVLEVTNSPDLFVAARDVRSVAESNSDVEFLERYFELADPMNTDVRDFFEKSQFIFMETLYKLGDAKTVGKSLGEIVFDDIEKKSIDFKTVDVAGALITLAIGWLVFESCKDAFKGHVVKPVREELVEKLGLANSFGKLKKSVGDNKGIISGAVAAGFVAWVAYKLSQREASNDIFIEDILAGEEEELIEAEELDIAQA